MKGRKRVLIVDDEDTIVLGLHRVLYKDNADYDVLLASTAEIAQSILQGTKIDVMLTDVRLPGMSGLDLLYWASTESPSTRVIVMTAFDTTGLFERAYPFGCLMIVAKPFDLHLMRKHVRGALFRHQTLGGSLAALSPADLMQMLCLSRKSTVLRVVDGSDVGLVYIEEGEVKHAVWNELAGEVAIYRLLGATEGMFDTLSLPPDVPTTIHADWQHLLLEGMRRQDEQGAGVAKTPLAPSPPRPQRTQRITLGVANTAGATDDVAKLVDQGFAALRDGNLQGAKRLWSRALELEPANRMIALNLRKLERKEQADDAAD